MGFIAVLVTADLPARAQQSLTWTSGAVGGGWYSMCGGIAELMRDKAGLDIKVVPGGGAQNAVLIQKGEAQIGMGLPPLLQAAADSAFASMTLEEIVRGRKPIRLAISRPGLSDVWAFEKIMRFYGLCAGPR